MNNDKQRGLGSLGLPLFIGALLVGSLSVPALPRAEAIAARRDSSLFTHAAELLAAQQGFTADFEVITTYATPYLDTKEVGSVYLARPNRLRIEIQRHRRVKDGTPWEPTGNGSLTLSDGKRAWNVTTHPRSVQYETQPAGDAWRPASLSALSPLASFFSGNPISPGDTTAVSESAEGGERFTVATFTTPDETRAFYFDAGGYLRRVVTERTGPTNGGRGSYSRRDVRLSKLRPLPADEALSRFVYAPPADAVRMERPRRAAQEGPRIGIGDVAPEIVAEDVNGKPVRLSDFAGKPVVVKFWATWCWPCRQSLPETEALAKESGNKAIVLAVALWDSRESFRDFVTRYADQRGTTPDRLPIRFVFDPHPQGQDVGSLLYGIRATPTHFVVGRDGKVTFVDAGYSGQLRKLAEALTASR